MNKIAEAEKLVDVAFDEGFETFGKVAKAHKKVEKILDALEERNKEEVDLGQGSSWQARPYDHPKKIRAVVDVDECGMGGGMGGGRHGQQQGEMPPMDDDLVSTIGGLPNDDDSDPGAPDDDYADVDLAPSDNPNDIPSSPNQDGTMAYKQVIKQLGEADLTEASPKLLKFFKGLLNKWKGADDEMDPDMSKALNKQFSGWKSEKLSEADEAKFEAAKKKCMAKADSIRHKDKDSFKMMYRKCMAQTLGEPFWGVKP